MSQAKQLTLQKKKILFKDFSLIIWKITLINEKYLQELNKCLFGVFWDGQMVNLSL